MNWTEIFTIVGSITAFNWYFLSRIEKDIETINRRMDGHAMRIDQLYHIIVEMLKK